MTAAGSTRLSIHESQITSPVCRSCAGCCQVRLKLTGTDSRYRVFLRTLGFTVLPAREGDQEDCCDKVHDVDLDMGPCRHLEQTSQAGGETAYRCKLHGTDRYPKLCSEYNCVSWAKAFNTYNAGNSMLLRAQTALARIQLGETSARATDS